MYRKKALLCLLMVVLLIPALGIHAQTSGGTLRFAFNADWGVLDPAVTSTTFGRNILQFIYDPLLRKNPETGEIVPGLAESFESSEDGMTLTLHLRDGVTFHDGTPLTSAAVKFSFDRISDPALASPYAASIVGPVASIETPDDLTVVITLNAPFAPYLDSLTQAALAPVSPAAVEQYGADFGLNPVGTGPFRLVSNAPDEEVVLERNPDYNWAPDYYDHQGPAYLDGIVVLNVTDDSTRMSLVETGDVDLIYNPLINQLDFFRDDPAYTIATAIRPGVPRVVILNTEAFPFDDAATRRAVAWGIDRERLLAEVWSGIGNVPAGIITPNLLGFWADGEWPGYDPDMALSLLAEAGWMDSDGDGILDKDGQAFSITWGQTPGFPSEQFGQIIVNDLAQLGIDVTIETEDQAAYLADIRAGKWQIASMLFAATDPDVLYTVAHSASIDAAWNTARYNNPDLDALLLQGRTTLDQTARAAIYQQAQEILLNDMPYIPFYQIDLAFVLSSRVQGFRTDAQGFFDFYETYFAE